MISRLFNNFGILSLGIGYTAQEFGGPLPVSKAILIAPLITHRRLLDFLARKTTGFPTLEELIIERAYCFANFEARFYASLCESLNAIQFLVDLQIAELKGDALLIPEQFGWSGDLGKRAVKIEMAAPRIASVLTNPTSSLYTSLRIRL